VENNVKASLPAYGVRQVLRATRFFVDFLDGQKSQSQSRLERQCKIENQIKIIITNIKNETQFPIPILNLILNLKRPRNHLPIPKI